MQVWKVRLAANAGPKKVAKNHHLSTIPQICRAISSKLRYVSTIGKKLVKQHYLLHISAQYGELRPTKGWDRFISLGHPCKFQRVLRLGNVTARHRCIGHQLNVAAFNRGRHLYLAGRPSRWALAHISSYYWHLWTEYLILMMMLGLVSRCFYTPHSAQLCRRFLKLFTELAETTVLGRPFQIFTTRWPYDSSWLPSWTGDHGGCRYFYCIQKIFYLHFAT